MSEDLLDFENKVRFIVDGDGAREAVIMPMAVYEELIAFKGEMARFKALAPEKYEFRVKHASATGYPRGDKRKPSFLVLAGSSANKSDASSLRPAVQKLRLQLVSDGILVEQDDCYQFTDDYEFSSTSMAACLVAGNARSGLDAWINKAGLTLKERGFGS